MKVTIVGDVAPAVGWAPIRHMQRLLTGLLNAEFIDISNAKSNRFQSIFYPYVGRSRNASGGTAIFIAWGAYGARKFVPLARALGGFERVILWIVDSFWTNATQRESRLIARHFDHVIYMQAYDKEFYERLFGDRAILIPWGSDVLGNGGANPERSYDLLRIGRQPPSWENDHETAMACRNLGLTFAGRPPAECAIEDIPGHLMQHWYGQSRFVLAHSNVVAPSPDTHQSKGYITARWTDGLGSGAILAGMPPTEDLELIDWPGSLLRLPTLDRAEGLEMIAAAVEAWKPEMALRNHLESLRRLDWRWRFQDLLRRLDIPCKALTDEVDRLNSRIAYLSNATVRLHDTT